MQYSDLSWIAFSRWWTGVVKILKYQAVNVIGYQKYSTLYSFPGCLNANVLLFEKACYFPAYNGYSNCNDHFTEF